jgi:hypothetical protein
MYCDFLEDRALNRISEREFMMKKLDWEDRIRTRIPEFYRMEAKSIYFNFFELEIIRREINDDLEKFYNSKIKNLVFATSAKIYAYPNQVVSVRIILAKFYRIPEEDIEEQDELKAYKELMKKQAEDRLNNNLIEEEVDSDDEEEENVSPGAGTAKPKTDMAKNNKEVSSGITIENLPKK